MKTTVVLEEGQRRRRLVLVGPLPPPWSDVSVHVQALAQLASAEGLDGGVLDTGGDRAGRIGRELARAAGQGALLHLHTHGDSLRAWMLALSVASSRLPGRPGGIVSVHGAGAPQLLARSRTARALARATAAGASLILCSSESAALSLGRAGVAASKLEVVPSFVPAEAGIPPAVALAARGRFHPLLVVPADVRAPGLLDLLAAAMERLEMPQAGALLLGPGVPGTPRPRMVHAGEISHPAALATLALADLVVRPSSPDTDAMPVREALSLGVRVLASDAAHRPPAVRLFRSGDADDLAEGIAASLEGPPPDPDAAGDDPRPRILRLWRRLGAGPRVG